MYAQHFHFSELPFSIAPDPRYLYLSDPHREALAHLLYGIGAGGGFVLLTGEVGTGKTTLCRCLLEQLPEDVDLALIFNPRLSPRELLATICDELHIPYPEKGPSLKTLIDRLNHHLLDRHARGRRTIVLIDEAQNLRFDVLEQIRLLTNLETNRDKLLQIILVGQPELNDLLGRRNLRQLSQRVTARFHLLPLSQGETGAYIAHRLAVSGVRTPLFTRRAVRAIHRCAGGIPRLVNLLCDRALLGAYSRGEHKVGVAVVRKAAREALPPDRTRRFGPAAVALSSAAAILSIAALIYHGYLPHPAWLPEPHAPGKDLRAESTESARTAPPKPISGPVTTPAEPVTATASDTSALTDVPADAPLATPQHHRAGPPTEPEGEFTRFVGEAALTRNGAFTPLWPLWGVEPPDAEADVCRHAERHGLRCLAANANWFQWRGFNRPAILELLLPDGGKRYVALVGIDGQKVELASGDRRATFELADILPLWRGDGVLLWKPPSDYTKALKPGERSTAVRWLRQRLGNKAAAGKEDFFDDKLKSRLVAFQRERGLTPDGVAGPSTLIHLDGNAENPAAPRLEALAP
jgi:general secretion pathway protein A